MSGGSLRYQHHNLTILAEDIERQLRPSDSGDYVGDNWLFDATPAERTVIMREWQSLVAVLNQNARRAKALEWFLSGDTGIKSYLDALDRIYDGSDE